MHTVYTTLSPGCTQRAATNIQPFLTTRCALQVVLLNKRQTATPPRLYGKHGSCQAVGNPYHRTTKHFYTHTVYRIELHLSRGQSCP
jgi:hypothetical protein